MQLALFQTKFVTVSWIVKIIQMNSIAVVCLYFLFKNYYHFMYFLKNPTTSFLYNIFSGGCKSGQYQCGDGNCVNKNQICDGKYDCVDWADERDCSKF